MSNKEERQEKKRKEKQQSDLVTKETFGAVCALFALLALLILCTGDLVFGEIGYSVCVFLTGVFGYAAYPVLIAVVYVSVTSLIGKRLIKNRKSFTCAIATLFFIALVVHTALTFSWGADTYLAQCFAAGESFPAVTVCGWVGGMLVLALTSTTTNVGAIIIFSALAIFSCYLSYVFAKKGKESADKVEKQKPVASVQAVEIPLAQAQPQMSPQVQVQEPQVAAPVFQEDSGLFTQRPAFSLSDETAVGDGQATDKPVQSSAFSPFAVPNSGKVNKTPAYEDPRSILFGGTPAENYKKNLIFDPNANVNKRSISDFSTTPRMPSYTESYANALNETPLQPQKIFTDRSQETPTYMPERLQPIEETPIIPVLEEEPVAPTTIEETPLERERVEEYQRHDYMDLFSSKNPNVFGRDEESRAFADDIFERTDREAPVLSRGRDFDLDEEPRERGGLDIFDEPTEEDYTLRMDVEPVQDRFVSERDVEENDRGYIDEVEEVKPQPVVAPAPQPAPPKPRIIRPYLRMPLDDFDCRDVEPQQNPEEVEETKATILATLEDYKVTGASIASVTFGPTVTRYNVTIPRNIPPKKVVSLDQPMAISLFTAGVNIYPNYEDGVVSIEVPNKERQFVQLGCMLTGDSYVNAKSSSLMFTMGKDAGNRKVYGDISKMIHLLVAGSSGSGKSVFLGSLIISLIHKYSPEELRLILIDPKKTEFVLYNNLPHLMINEIITDANKAVQSLNWAIGEMNRRYGLFEQMSRAGTYVVNLDQYNQHIEKNERLPKIVIIIDELADLMLAAKKDIEDRIQNLTQKARAAGIHLVVATQRPSTDVITGVIKSNLPTRIAFGVATDVDSRVILDQTGAQKLLGKGDFLYTMQGINTPVRVQSAFISAEDSQRVVNYIKTNNEAYYDENATAFINNTRGGSDGGSGGMGSGDEIEPVYIEALRYVILSNSASISLIQRKCSIGYNKAGKIVEWMEDMGYISSFEGAKARKVLITKEEFESKYGSI